MTENGGFPFVKISVLEQTYVRISNCVPKLNCCISFKKVNHCGIQNRFIYALSKSESDPRGIKNTVQLWKICSAQSQAYGYVLKINLNFGNKNGLLLPYIVGREKLNFNPLVTARPYRDVISFVTKFF